MTEKTTFILGAGASVDYGYPTGQQLIDNIIEVDSNSDEFSQCLLSYKQQHYANEFREKIKKYDPLSIDRYLGMHSNDEHLVKIGKLLISREVLRNQNLLNFTRENKSNWYKYLFEYVFKDNDFEKRLDSDEFRIITFNYDLSLEYFFHSRLEQIPSLSEQEAWSIFCKFKEKVHHVYGEVYDYFKIHEEGIPSLGTSPASSEGRYYFINRLVNSEQYIDGIGDNIKIIGEERELKNTPELRYLRSHLATSHRIFIFGFGFDEVNCDLIGLTGQQLSNFRKHIYATNYSNIPIITQKIRNLDKKTEDLNVSSGHIFETSAGTVTEALNEDFLL